MIKYIIFVAGILTLLYAVISLYYVSVLASLMYGKFPWYYQNWNSIRENSNQLLVKSGIRNLTPKRQFEYMTVKQKNSIENHYKDVDFLSA